MFVNNQLTAAKKWNLISKHGMPFLSYGRTKHIVYRFLFFVHATQLKICLKTQINHTATS
jgi:hypothetical protein